MIHRVVYLYTLLYIIFINQIPVAKSAVVNDVCERQTVRRSFILDAGSTGTRLNLFVIRKKDEEKTSKIAPSSIIIQTAKSVSKRAPISSFDSKTKMPQLRLLMKKFLADAEKSAGVSSKCFKYIPILFRATAGVRAMAKPLQERILKEIASVFGQSEFKKSRNPAMILSGQDEGFYAWLSLNLLLKKLDSSAISNTVDLLELGGGSMQISTYEVAEDYSSQLKNIFVFGNSYRLYVKSYLGLGIQAVRIQFFDDDNKSICMAKEGKFDYVFGSKSLSLSGKDTKDDRYSICSSMARLIVRKIDPVWKSVEKLGEIQGLSAFYYIVSNANYVINNCAINKAFKSCKKKSFHKSTTQLITEAKQICRNPPKANKYHVTLCIDMVYLINVLEHGFQLGDKSKKLLFSRKANGRKTSWSLGIASKMSYDSFTGTESKISYDSPIVTEKAKSRAISTSTATGTYRYTIFSLVSPLLIYFCNSHE